MRQKLTKTKYFKIFSMVSVVSLIIIFLTLYFLREWGLNNPVIVEKGIALAENYGPWGIFFVAFLAGTLIPFPTEPVIGGAAVLGQQKLYTIVIMALLGNTLGFIVSFYTARMLREAWVYKRVDKEAIDAFQKFWDYYGNIILFIFVLFPIFPGDIVAFIAGLSEMKMRDFIILVTVAKLISYTAIVWLSFRIATAWFGFVFV
ncbi:MAG: VTT domain-containing protein [archaeon]